MWAQLDSFLRIVQSKGSDTDADMLSHVKYL